jgi:hypothetical protein
MDIFNVTNGNGKELGRYATQEDAEAAAQKEARKHKYGAFMVWKMVSSVQSDSPNDIMTVADLEEIFTAVHGPC